MLGSEKKIAFLKGLDEEREGALPVKLLVGKRKADKTPQFNEIIEAIKASYDGKKVRYNTCNYCWSCWSCACAWRAAFDTLVTSFPQQPSRFEHLSSKLARGAYSTLACLPGQRKNS